MKPKTTRNNAQRKLPRGCALIAPTSCSPRCGVLETRHFNFAYAADGEGLSNYAASLMLPQNSHEAARTGKLRKERGPAGDVLMWTTGNKPQQSICARHGTPADVG
jgi:hypothetical protein